MTNSFVSSVRTSGFKAAALEACKANGLYWAATSFWTSGVLTLIAAHKFGGNTTDIVSGWVDGSALAISFAFGNKAYAPAAALSLVGNAIQQSPYIANGNLWIGINLAVMSLGTAPAIAERWLKPRADAYLKQAQRLTFKKAAATLCSKARITGAAIQNLCHIPVGLAAYETHDAALMAALGLFVAGNCLAAGTKRAEPRSTASSIPSLEL